MIYIYLDPEYWVRAMNNYIGSLIICSWSDIFDNIVMTEKKVIVLSKVLLDLY